MRLFSLKSIKIKKYKGRKSYQCNSCFNADYWKLIKITAWVKLLFIPLFPYKKNYFLLCPNCNNSIKLSEEIFVKYKDNQLAIH